eukprot:8562912-Pyramimonas_sp.AAC.1
MHGDADRSVDGSKLKHAMQPLAASRLPDAIERHGRPRHRAKVLPSIRYRHRLPRRHMSS